MRYRPQVPLARPSQVPTMKPDDSEELRRFLKMLDDSEAATVSDWEAQFIGSNLSRDHFSPKQREIVMNLMEKFGQRIGWY